jgi:hypothetical protein
MVLKVDFTEKELIEIINNTITNKQDKEFILKNIRQGKIIPIRGYGYGLS